MNMNREQQFKRELTEELRNNPPVLGAANG